jgi:lipopolysaccharide export system permease protein
MLYFILISIGENLANTKVLSPFWGMWLGGLFFTPVAIFISYHASNDSEIFNKEFWLTIFKKKSNK